MENSQRIEDLKWLKTQSGFGYQECFDMYKACNENKAEALRRLEAVKASAPTDVLSSEEYAEFSKYREKYLEAEAKRVTKEEWRKKHKWLQYPTVGRWISTVVGVAFIVWAVYIGATHINDEHPWVFLLSILPGTVGGLTLLGTWFEMPEPSGTYQAPKAKRRRHSRKNHLASIFGGAAWVVRSIFREAGRKKKSPFEHSPGITKDKH